MINASSKRNSEIIDNDLENSQRSLLSGSMEESQELRSIKEIDEEHF